MTNEIKAKATVLKSFLNEKGYKVKHTECIEAVSKIEFNQCYNVAKNDAVRILKYGEHLTFEELKNKDFSVEVVIPLDMDNFMEGIEVINDIASESITGSSYALCDIGYEIFPHFYGTSSIAVKVTGYIEDVESLSNLDDYEEEGFETED